MRSIAGLSKSLIVAAAVFGIPSFGSAAPATIYRGELWMWDPTTSVATLVQGDQKVRVKAARDQLIGVRDHDIVTLRGELAPPAEIQRIVVPAPPMRAVPSEPTDETTIIGTIAAVNPAGVVSITVPHGPLDVWVATPVADRFRTGETVQLRTTIQAVRMIPLAPGTVSSPAPELAGDGGPGDRAVVMGRILALESTGRVTVESPRGPVNVWVTDTTRYRVGQIVQVRTSLANQLRNG